ncbi:RNA polymerase sigma factor [Tuwongella immobilis]|uniref:Uncharacterized protein n=1 Tax=Tuwongella immobilis TaxID=692036 RepID=A0A6C2YXD0_9BACT|nr:sigma-70 family RNA polymerase sigma factor [Tuwongella immobilis]VIP05773.1 rna polymerase sigma70 factor : Putative RNA polymerase sigma factor containing a TPR repeat domain OS=Synechococcus sp. (strain ATCC 27167 / PCC 6312) GN=Syn6312_2622 PE=4 SV=1: Sigma70_r2 [Tuwongella immobilis]VTS08902.1 rna polymerase sigma70 factor : Putative RNA polymerase sigma factor containing a TPR repeat domain OS=Synechococcus sp. (strain ATCC 27167 / PCC 6312) GN=Syn6312_2622 PE=4 SV=1: Sigma70_r2 [Tuwonge
MATSPTSDLEARRIAEQMARFSYGRLIAFVANRTHDLMAAEDALSEAFLAALESWPIHGIPRSPEAWLLTTARRRLIDLTRRAARLESLTSYLDESIPQRETPETTFLADERLQLLFTCSHPAIDPLARTPLLLQTVLGLDAERIASAFLVSPATMSQRLVRAKTKIRDTGISFELPEPDELPNRLESVLDAIYAAYGTGWDAIDGADPQSASLAEEAIWLGQTVVDLLPNQPESRGLLALMQFSHARRSARRDANGNYVPLDSQNCHQWDTAQIAAAEQHLFTASTANQPGRFQIEAAIQSAHIQRLQLGIPNWPAIVLLYEGLVRFSPTLGALVNRAAAIGKAYGPQAWWLAWQSIPPDSVRDYQPYWVTAAHWLHQLGQPDAALAAHKTALGLTQDPTLRRFLLQNPPHPTEPQSSM